MFLNNKFSFGIVGAIGKIFEFLWQKPVKASNRDKGSVSASSSSGVSSGQPSPAGSVTTAHVARSRIPWNPFKKSNGQRDSRDLTFDNVILRWLAAPPISPEEGEARKILVHISFGFANCASSNTFVGHFWRNIFPRVRRSSMQIAKWLFKGETEQRPRESRTRISFFFFSLERMFAFRGKLIIGLGVGGEAIHQRSSIVAKPTTIIKQYLYLYIRRNCVFCFLVFWNQWSSL